MEITYPAGCPGKDKPGAVGRASLSAAKIDYQSITEKAHSFTHINVKTVRFLPLPN